MSRFASEKTSSLFRLSHLVETRVEQAIATRAAYKSLKRDLELFDVSVLKSPADWCYYGHQWLAVGNHFGFDGRAHAREIERSARAAFKPAITPSTSTEELVDQIARVIATGGTVELAGDDVDGGRVAVEVGSDCYTLVSGDRRIVLDDTSTGAAESALRAWFAYAGARREAVLDQLENNC